MISTACYRAFSAKPTVALLFVILFSGLLSVQAGMWERHLINKLLEDYNKLERPVVNESDKLNVNFSVTLQQIIDVDEKNQMLISNLWLNIKWNDVNLMWKPEEYGNVTSIRIAPDRIWLPDMLLYNSADERFDSTYRTNVVVNSDGNMLYVPPGIFKSTCQIDITWFPFDDQKCILKFGTWTHDGGLVDVSTETENATADTSAYIQNSEWVLVGVPSNKHVDYYDCCPAPYIDITYTVHIKRRTLYYGFNLIIPCIILSSMTLLSFSLPPESGEKLHLGVTILLSMTVFLVQLGKILPATSDSVSIIALYFGSIMVMVAFSVVMTVVVLNFHHRSTETKEMGPKLKVLLLNWLPRVIGMERPGIKPPKQCIQKKPSKTQLISQKILCGSRQMMNEMENRRAPLPPLPPAPFGNYVPHPSDNVGSGVPGETLIGMDMFEDNSQMGQLQQGGILGPEMHPHFGLYEHEVDCIYANKNGGLKNGGGNIGEKMDSGSVKMETNVDFQIGDDDEQEQEQEEQEDSQEQEDDLDISISLTESSELKSMKSMKTENKMKSLKSKILDLKCKNQLKKKAAQSQSSSNHSANHNHDPLHHAHHEYMSMKRKHKLLEILLEMKYITDRLRNEDETKELIAEWRYAATVLDRCCLIMFTMFTIASLAICLLSAPQLIV